MLINNNWKIESDSLNVILYKKRVVSGKSPNSCNKTKMENIGKEIWEANYKTRGFILGGRRNLTKRPKVKKLIHFA